MMDLISWCTLRLLAGFADRTIKYRVPKQVGNVMTVDRTLDIKEGE